MTTQSNGAAETRPLSILGIGEFEERAYRWLLGHSGATVQDLSQALLLSPRKAQQLLAVLEAKGLATHSPERPRRYIPASPDIALKALSFRHQEGLQRVDSVIQELQEQAVTQRQGEQEQMIELITSREAARQAFEQVPRMAQQEIIVMVRPPILISRLNVPASQGHPAQREAQTRGVRFRNIVDTEFLTWSGALQYIREDMKAGEEVKVFPDLPFKLILADHSLALIPLNLQQSDSPLLLVRSPALLDALRALFEMIWEKASPISFTRKGVLERGDPDSQVTEETADLISMMAAGLNDKNIAHEFGISRRTHQRHVTELMQILGTRTRFQAGWVAALRLSAAGAIPGVRGSSRKQVKRAL